MSRLDGKVAIITGAGKDLGPSLCHESRPRRGKSSSYDKKGPGWSKKLGFCKGLVNIF